MRVRIGVLALQGAFELHRWHLEQLGAEYVEVTKASELKNIHGLILPGGESGVMLKLIEASVMREALQEFFKTKPAWGICAGAILMARQVHNPKQFSFSALDLEIERNSYGRQLESCFEVLEGYEVSYIRAPKILKVGSGLNVLAMRLGDPIWVASRLHMVTTFHPETNREHFSPWHSYLIERAEFLAK